MKRNISISIECSRVSDENGGRIVLEYEHIGLWESSPFVGETGIDSDVAHISGASLEGANMCISMSVGRNGVNKWDDVRTVQILINLNMEKLASLGPLAENGLIGSRTIGAVE